MGRSMNAFAEQGNDISTKRAPKTSELPAFLDSSTTIG
jgi:hypothetical protein